MSNQENTECMEGNHQMVKMIPATAMPRLPGCTLRSLNKHIAGWKEKAVPQEAIDYKHSHFANICWVLIVLDSGLRRHWGSEWLWQISASAELGGQLQSGFKWNMDLARQMHHILRINAKSILPLSDKCLHSHHCQQPSTGSAKLFTARGITQTRDLHFLFYIYIVRKCQSVRKCQRGGLKQNRFSFFLLEYGCFTMLCSFLLYNEMNQLYVYIHFPPT